ncbi:uncharacterized protein LOC123677728 [Harmonia axyridis]|uniref:uncharacterized protein LOC123677728 n=1 Tax=Harmonia axyridis TaxID=115357 RepID=UPI001E279508|nr:uncharacterized protein LOC123677728 [Harmonia axyridis]XP_045470374.1 uncharacterized protein LOC123677728 [Harmonia axyridis]
MLEPNNRYISWLKPGTVLLTLIIFTIPECLSLRLTNMTAPLIQDPRENMNLFCEFDMGGEDLYAVKWYKDDHEFFRYSPAGQQQLLQFQVLGVHVDVSRTKCSMTSCNLVLNDLSRTFSSGAYRCEVSTEAPTFRLASQTHNITVAVIPRNNPTIEGMKDRYVVGDYLEGSCTSGLGDPKPIISWYLNNKPVEKNFIRELTQRPTPYYQKDGEVKLESTTVQLRLPLDKKIIGNKTITYLELACLQSSDMTAAAASLFRNTTKIIALTEEPLINNQKLYGFFGASSRIQNSSLLMFIVMLCFIY